MSRRPDPCSWRPLQRLRRTGDEGFSLVEVMVAMLVFAIVAVASLGMLTSALSATAMGRLETVAKGAGQERMESMRNLPYSVSATVSTTSPDLLDRYYTGTTSTFLAPNTASTGFVPATGARDVRRGDPDSGAFYRVVFAAGSVPGAPQLRQRVTTQFMQTETGVLANPVFVSSSTGKDGFPPASTVAVRVTSLWDYSGKEKVSTVYSQIAEGAARPPLVTLQGRLALLRISGILPLARELNVEAGLASLDASLSNSTAASSTTQGVFASIAGGQRIDGAKQIAAAPPSVIMPDVSAETATLMDGTSVVAQLSRSASTKVSAFTSNGQPGAGTATEPVRSSLFGSPGFSQADLVLSASHLPSTATRLRLAAAPAAQLVSPSCGVGCRAVAADGYATSTGGATHSATASLTGSMNGELRLLPTATSPEGLLKVRLSSFSLTCDSRAGSTPAASAAAAYSGTLQYRTYDPVTGAYGYSSGISLSATNESDPLASIDREQVVGVDNEGGLLRLKDYVGAWSSLTKPAIAQATQVAANGFTASVAFPGVFTFASTPLRTEAESTIGVQLGAASCVAGDLR